jgi:hypothetical protein
MESPKTFDDLLLDRDQIAEVKDWLLHGEGICVLTQEQTGCGVSTMISMLLKTLEDRVHPITCVEHGTNTMSVLGQKKVMVLDPLECVLMDQSVSRKVPALLADPKIPILIAGFKRRISIAKLEDMLKKCKSVPIKRLHIEGIRDEDAHRFLASKGCTNPEHVWKESDHDLRHSLMSIQSASIKERLPDGIDGLRELLEGSSTRTYREMVRVIEHDPTIMLDGLYENYIHGIPSSGGDMRICDNVLDAIGLSDIFAANRFTSTCYDMQPEVYGTLAGIGYMGLRLRKKIETFGTMWARENHRHSKQALLRKVSLAGAHKDDLPFIRSMLYQNPETQAPRFAALYGDKALWDITRLWTRSAREMKYTSSRHASLLEGPAHPPAKRRKPS